jgi:hypothetical protein
MECTMPQAENVVTFPLDRTTTDLLRDFIGPPQQRLDEVSHRLASLEALIGLATQAVDLPAQVSGALSAIEVALHDCLVVAELRPVEYAR